MKKIPNYIFPIFIAVSTVLLVVFVSQVSAQREKPGSAGNSGQDQNASPGLSRKPSGVSPFGKARLEEAKLRVCRLREKNIVNRSNQMIRHANRMVEVFGSIAARIQNYYLTRLVPQGKTLPNYDVLVSDVQTNKNAIAPLLQALQTDISNFKCDGDNPGGQLTQFRTDIQAVIQGLKAYKTSIRNLIVAVASIRGETSGNASGSAAAPSVVPSAAP